MFFSRTSGPFRPSKPHGTSRHHTVNVTISIWFSHIDICNFTVSVHQVYYTHTLRDFPWCKVIVIQYSSSIWPIRDDAPKLYWQLWGIHLVPISKAWVIGIGSREPPNISSKTLIALSVRVHIAIEQKNALYMLLLSKFCYCAVQYNMHLGKVTLNPSYTQHTKLLKLTYISVVPLYWPPFIQSGGTTPNPYNFSIWIRFQLQNLCTLYVYLLEQTTLVLSPDSWCMVNIVHVTVYW